MSKKENEQAVTFFTGIVITPSVTESIILDELIRKFQSAKRYLRERILDGLDRKSAVAKAQPLFL